MLGKDPKHRRRFTTGCGHPSPLSGVPLKSSQENKCLGPSGSTKSLPLQGPRGQCGASGHRGIGASSSSLFLEAEKWKSDTAPPFPKLTDCPEAVSVPITQKLLQVTGRNSETEDKSRQEQGVPWVGLVTVETQASGRKCETL